MSVVAIIPAAGSGARVGGGAPKQYLPLAGMPVLARTLAAFDASPIIDDIVLVIPPGDEVRCRAVAVAPYAWTKLRAIVPGGPFRQDSVARGLDAASSEVSIVVVHDAARPLVTDDVIRRVVTAAVAGGASLAALPVVDTLKRSLPGGVVATVDREGLWAAQTPQAFQAPLFRDAVARAKADGFVGTDDASLVERLGVPVTLVEGELDNFKITRSEDLARAETVLSRRTAQTAGLSRARGERPA